MDGAPFTAFRHTADAVLEAAGEFVADPAVADVDCGIGLLTGLISRLEGLGFGSYAHAGLLIGPCCPPSSG